MEEHTKFFKTILIYGSHKSDHLRDRNKSDNFLKIFESLSELEMNVSLKNDVHLLQKFIYEACHFWNKNVFLSVDPNSTLYFEAINTFKIFDQMNFFILSIYYLKFNILSNH